MNSNLPGRLGQCVEALASQPKISKQVFAKVDCCTFTDADDAKLGTANNTNRKMRHLASQRQCRDESALPAQNQDVTHGIHFTILSCTCMDSHNRHGIWGKVSVELRAQASHCRLDGGDFHWLIETVFGFEIVTGQDILVAV